MFPNNNHAEVQSRLFSRGTGRARPGPRRPGAGPGIAELERDSPRPQRPKAPAAPREWTRELSRRSLIARGVFAPSGLNPTQRPVKINSVNGLFNLSVPRLSNKHGFSDRSFGKATVLFKKVPVFSDFSHSESCLVGLSMILLSSRGSGGVGLGSV